MLRQIVSVSLLLGVIAVPVIGQDSQAEIKYYRVSMHRNTAEHLREHKAEIGLQIQCGDRQVFSSVIAKPWQWSVISREGLFIPALPRASDPIQVQFHAHATIDGRPVDVDLQLTVKGVASDFKTLIDDDRLEIRAGVDNNSFVWKIPALPRPAKTLANTGDSVNDASAQSVTTDTSDAPLDNTTSELEGVWEVVESVENGRPNSQRFQVVIQGNQITLANESYKFRVDTAKDPSEIDMMDDGGTSPLRGIYEIEGDRMLLCYVMQFEILETDFPRPTDFNDVGDSENGEYVRWYSLRRISLSTSKKRTEDSDPSTLRD